MRRRRIYGGNRPAAIFPVSLGSDLRASVERHYICCFFCWKDLPIPLCFFRSHNLAVSAEQHLRASVTKLHRDTRRIVNRCQPIRSEGVAQAIVRPLREFRRHTHPTELAPCAPRNDRPCHPAKRLQPGREIQLYRNDSPSGALGLGCLHFDVSTRKIDFAPV